MKAFLLLTVVLAVFASCGKSKFETTPQVDIVSFGPDEVHIGETFQLRANVTDKEGDLQDSFYLVKKRFTGTTVYKIDTTGFSLSKLGFPTNNSIELQLTFAYGVISLPGTIVLGDQEPVDRGLIYGIIVRDKAHNKSDYKETNRITLLKKP